MGLPTATVRMCGWESPSQHSNGYFKVQNWVHGYHGEYDDHVQVVCGTMGLPTATVRMRGPDGIARTSTGMGTGPVDAAYKAIDSLVRVQVVA